MLNLLESYSILQITLANLQTVAIHNWPFASLIIGFSLLSLCEFQLPKMPIKARQLINAYRVNLGLFVLNSILMSAVSLTGLWFVLEHFSGEGLLHGMRKTFWKALLSFLLLDLLLYVWHRICHSFDVLWMFHKVHHSDPYLNVTTAFRIHIIELLITTLLKAVYIVVLGIDKSVVMFYEAVYPLFVMFHHTNIAFPGEKWLGQMIVTPHLHRTHHSIEREQHDSNYGAIFSLWDRLFLSRKEAPAVAVGIKPATPTDVWGLLKFGFVNTAPPTSAPIPVGSFAVNVHAMIAEAAYYKAEKRAFSPGYELYDWLEAKKEINRQVDKRCINC